MDIKSIRRKNLKTLVASAKNQSAFAEFVGTSPARISQLLNGNSGGEVPMGRNFAERLEGLFKLQEFWMDTDHDQVETRRVPVLSTSDLYDNVDRSTVVGKMISPDMPVSENSFAFVVTDDGMGSSIQKGHLVIVDPAVDVTDGKIVLVKGYGQAYVRTFSVDLSTGIQYLKPYNEKHHTVALTADIEIMGVVTEARYTLLKAA